MADVRITTNGVPRDVIDAWALTAEERAQFDYLNWEAIDAGEDSASFFRYRGELYDLSEFERIGPGGDMAGWDGYRGDSFFSGLVVRYERDEWGEIDGERVIVGLLLA